MSAQGDTRLFVAEENCKRLDVFLSPKAIWKAPLRC